MGHEMMKIIALTWKILSKMMEMMMVLGMSATTVLMMQIQGKKIVTRIPGAMLVILMMTMMV